MHAVTKMADFTKFCQSKWIFMNLIILVNFSQISQSRISLVELTIFTNWSQILHSTIGQADLTLLRIFCYCIHFWTHLNLRWSFFFYFSWNSSFQIITELAISVQVILNSHNSDDLFSILHYNTVLMYLWKDNHCSLQQVMTNNRSLYLCMGEICRYLWLVCWTPAQKVWVQTWPSHCILFFWCWIQITLLS